MDVTLAQVLACREKRSARQEALIGQYGKPLICFTMNIAGPEKLNPLIREGFLLGERLLLAQLKAEKLPLLHAEKDESPAGIHGFYIADADPLFLKQLTAAIEEELPVGRLFDMDVLDAQGQKLGRATPRKCLLCDSPAYVCGRSRAHSVAQLQKETTRLLTQAVQEERSRNIAKAAQQSLLYEVCATPKPGLVDRANSGSHQDMDIFSFMASSAALFPYLERCARIGLQTCQLPPEQTFARLRLPGRVAEQAMLEATGGINTHKGAIFSLGILCAAAGRLPHGTPQALCAEAAAMVAGCTAQALTGLTENTARTPGEKLYAAYGITGIRGQAEAGFPAVLETGLPVLRQGLAQGLSLNDAGCAALLHLITVTQDTSLLHRSQPAVCRKLRQQLSRLLEEDPFPGKQTLEALDAQFREQNLSPGGSADLLALTYFLHFLTQ